MEKTRESSPVTKQEKLLEWIYESRPTTARLTEFNPNTRADLMFKLTSSVSKDGEIVNATSATVGFPVADDAKSDDKRKVLNLPPHQTVNGEERPPLLDVDASDDGWIEVFKPGDCAPVEQRVMVPMMNEHLGGTTTEVEGGEEDAESLPDSLVVECSEPLRVDNDDEAGDEGETSHAIYCKENKDGYLGVEFEVGGRSVGYVEGLVTEVSDRVSVGVDKGIGRD
ncbi:hypothetical protein MKZ38_009357 [Zalerion maritima]|uniref:Uncharacterized protein n=1 Tax=Zalerion maritima TaxID=339359 RepID=A0AAD5RUW5_9PEZI|nr:hypothetical protein MKZ38_009357 [Zalerion maritima]